MMNADTRHGTPEPRNEPGFAEAKDLKKELGRVQKQLAIAAERSDELIERAIEAESAKKEFMARVSYEIRTPLNAIIGCSQILAEELTTEEQFCQVRLIESSAQQLLDLIVDSMVKFFAAQGQDVDAGGDPIIRNPAVSTGGMPNGKSQHQALSDMKGLSDNRDCASRQRSFCGCVLVVDDNQVDRMIAQKLLSMCGLEVTIVKDGNEAVDAIRYNRYDLVLMDTEMPCKNGYDATRELRDLGVKTPIVALTGHVLEADRAKCIAAGCDDYLAKPISKAELMRILQTCLAQDKVVSDKVGGPPKQDKNAVREGYTDEMFDC